MTFRFNIDQKCTIWVREHHEVEADNLEEAKKKMIEEFKYNNEDTFMYQESLYDTMEDLTPTENGGPTRELFYEEEDELINNIEDFKPVNTQK